MREYHFIARGVEGSCRGSGGCLWALQGEKEKQEAVASVGGLLMAGAGRRSLAVLLFTAGACVCCCRIRVECSERPFKAGVGCGSIISLTEAQRGLVGALVAIYGHCR